MISGASVADVINSRLNEQYHCDNDHLGPLSNRLAHATISATNDENYCRNIWKALGVTTIIMTKNFDLTKLSVKGSDFPVFDFASVLPQALFEELNDTFEQFIGGAVIDGLFRQLHSDSDSHRYRSKSNQLTAWKALSDEVLSSTFISNLLSLLKANRSMWTSPIDFLRIWLRVKVTRLRVTISLHSGRRGYELTPHTDKADKFAALILYFGSTNPTAVAEGGTTFYRPKSRAESQHYLRELTGLDSRLWSFVPFRLLPFRSAGLPRVYSHSDVTSEQSQAVQRFRELHEPFYKSKFSSNNMVLFFKDNLTWHEVNLQNYPPGEERRSLLINIYCSPTLPTRIYHRVRDLFTN